MKEVVGRCSSAPGKENAANGLLDEVFDDIDDEQVEVISKAVLEEQEDHAESGAAGTFGKELLGGSQKDSAGKQRAFDA